MLVALGNRARRWAQASAPWTNVYGLARTLLALGTALTLTFSAPDTLFRPAAGIPEVPQCSEMRGAGLFCLLGAHHLELARWLSVMALLLVASGWRPRITGPLHWWISLSLQINAVMLDGGDQLTAVLTFILLPVTLTDGRRWHWDAPVAAATGTPQLQARLVARVALFLARLQMAAVYFHAAIAKFAVPEWSNGTALYYHLLDPSVGAAPWLAPLIRPLLTSAVTLPLLTWSVLLVEYVLSAGLLVEKRYRKLLLGLGLALHGGIIVVHGLVSFGLAMFAGLVLYLWPTDEPLALGGFAARAFRLRRTPRSERSLTAASAPGVQARA